MSSTMVLIYVLLFLFDIVLLVLVLLAFVEKRKLRREASRLLDSESSVLELSESMERLIEEYRRVASRIQDDTSAKRDELMRTIQRADRLLMELVRRSDRFELAVESHEARAAAAKVAEKRPRDVPPVVHERLGRPAKPAQPGHPVGEPVISAPAQARTVTERAGMQGEPTRPHELEKPATQVTGGMPKGAQRTPREAPADLAAKRVGSRTVRPFVAPTDMKQRAASPADEDEEINRTKRLVLDLSRQGLSIETIAKSLRVPIGQVKLILDVQKSKQS